ncbi:MAG: Caspase domain [Deltaproteobacteria bacterium]|jgi:hypothetical protein|nr:Caspase domain [Deltaproteobacteria bacterium]
MTSSDALLVTVADYPISNGALRPLPGSAKDGLRVANWLKLHAPGINVMPLSYPPPGGAGSAAGVATLNREAVESSMKTLLAQTVPAMRDRLFVYFSGHGRSNIALPAMPAVYCAQHRRNLPDLFFSFNWIPLLTVSPAYHEYLFFFDCCNDFQTDPLPAAIIPDIDPRTDRPSVLVVTAAQPGEQALESDDGGLFTDVLLEALSGSAGSPESDVVTAADLVNYLKEFVPGRARKQKPRHEQRPKVWFDSDQHADLKDYVLFKRDKVKGVDVSSLLDGHAAGDVDVLGFGLQPVTTLVNGAGGAATLEGVYPGRYVLKGRNDSWMQTIRITTPVEADGTVKFKAEALEVS